MKLSRYEQETIISFNEEEPTASVYTHNRALRNRLDKLAQERPTECRLLNTSHDGHAADYIIPKGWVRVRASRILSEAQKESLQKARLGAGNATHAANLNEKEVG